MRYGPVLVLAFLLSAILGTANAASISLEGYWTGEGTVSYKGSVDQVRCRVRYKKAGSKSFTYNSTCATENGRYELNGRISRSSGNRYTGVVSSENHKQTGKVLLLQRGNRLTVTVTNRKGSAKIKLSKRGS
jgi:hypothetical protein